MPVALASLLFMAAGSAQLRAEGTYLASIKGIWLGEHEYVDAFSIDTWGVEVIAVCRLPAGWFIKAGRSAGIYGAISGEATHGVTYLDQKGVVPELKGLFLLKLEEPLRPQAIGSEDQHLPATFSGKASIGTYGGDDNKNRKQKLTYRNIAFVPAKRCPAPRP